MESPFEGNMQWELQFEIESVDYDHEGDIQSTKLVYHADVVEPDEDDEENQIPGITCLSYSRSELAHPITKVKNLSRLEYIHRCYFGSWIQGHIMDYDYSENEQVFVNYRT